MRVWISFFFWLGALFAWYVSLKDTPRQFSEAHHFWYGAVLYWMGKFLVASGAGWWGLPFIVIGIALMIDDIGEHFTGFSIVKNIYGRLGGTY